MKNNITAGCFLILWICSMCHSATPNLREIDAVTTDSPPEIDGVLDDLCWQNATQSGYFIQYSPRQG